MHLSAESIEIFIQYEDFLKIPRRQMLQSLVIDQGFPNFP